MPEYRVFSIRYKLREVKKYFFYMSSNLLRIYMTKFIFHYLDFVVGSKNGGFW
jgi:hypothetical protein